MKAGAFGISFISSLVIHGLVILLGSFFIHRSNLHFQNYLPVNLIDLPQTEMPPLQKIETPPETKKPVPPPPKAEKPIERPPAAKPAIAKPEPSPPVSPAPIKEEPAKAIEAKTATPAKAEVASSARVEGGGSEAGAGNLFVKGDTGVVPGAGTAGGGGGTAVSGSGRGSGAPGLPAQSVLRTNREAKPIQTVRAAYPPMALRAGLESDVALRIEVDPQGNVTKAEITKSGGAGFDEEVLKAVKQSRFEPAQRDGHNVPAEFTFIYRFRLQK